MHLLGDLYLYLYIYIYIYTYICLDRYRYIQIHSKKDIQQKGHLGTEETLKGSHLSQDLRIGTLNMNNKLTLHLS